MFLKIKLAVHDVIKLTFLVATKSRQEAKLHTVEH